MNPPAVPWHNHMLGIFYLSTHGWHVLVLSLRTNRVLADTEANPKDRNKYPVLGDLLLDYGACFGSTPIVFPLNETEAVW